MNNSLQTAWKVDRITNFEQHVVQWKGYGYCKGKGKGKVVPVFN